MRLMRSIMWKGVLVITVVLFVIQLEVKAKTVSNLVKTSSKVAFKNNDKETKVNSYQISTSGSDGNNEIGLVAVDSTQVSSGTSTIMASIFNLAKTILGAGVLSLPFGVASFSDKPSALYLASFLLVLMGATSAYSFSSIAHACQLHGVTTFSEAWAKSVSPRSACLISFIITFKTFFACLAYSIIIGDSFSQILSSLRLPGPLASRNSVIVGLSSLVVLPLCCLRKLDALKYTSILGLLGTLYCAAFMGLRLWDGSYREGGRFFAQMASNLRPSFNQRAASPADLQLVFVLLSMISTAYVAHYNAPKFLAELRRPTMRRFNTVVGLSFGFAALVYLSVMTIGFLSFGGHATGFVLNNYASSDLLATAARVAVGGGILCGYPLTFTALRDGFLDLLQLPAAQRQRAYYPATLGLLGAVTAVALRTRNVGAVVSLSGALIGSLLIYIIPACLNLANIPRSNQYSRAQQRLLLLVNAVIAIAGAAISIVGVYINLVQNSGAAGH